MHRKSNGGYLVRKIGVRVDSVAHKPHKKKARKQSAPMFGMRMPRFRGF